MKQGPSCLFLQAAEVPRGLDWLGPAERQHLATLRWAKRRSDWLLGRWTAKQTVVRAPELRLDIQDLAELEVLPTPAGAPQTLLAGEPLPVAISLSHRAGAALCVVAKTGSLGCDLEWLEDRSEAFVEDYFTPSERTLIEEGGAEMQGSDGQWIVECQGERPQAAGPRVERRYPVVDGALVSPGESRGMAALSRPPSPG